jgi:hypothetical protein
MSTPRTSFVLLAFLAFYPQTASPVPFDYLRRLSETPILAPQGTTWESAGTFNPAVIRRDGKIVMLYRAQDKQGTSRLETASTSPAAPSRF